MWRTHYSRMKLGLNKNVPVDNLPNPLLYIFCKEVALRAEVFGCVHQPLDFLHVCIYHFLQTLQGLKQPVNWGQVITVVLIRHFYLYCPKPLLDVIQRALELQRLEENHIIQDDISDQH